PVLDRVGDFAAFVAERFDEDAAYAALRRAETIGRPVGDPGWLRALETRAKDKRGLSKLSPIL
ncbi:MAG: hypothetical protein GY798_21345, partial [Hyphomicrobiales bacterium]|nr:hypothetical protein [Hyphomicrobiales bacterium]